MVQNKVKLIFNFACRVIQLFRRAFKEDGPPPYADIFEDAEIMKQKSKSTTTRGSQGRTPYPYSESTDSSNLSDRLPKPVVLPSPPKSNQS